jgi:hypothetical protein
MLYVCQWRARPGTRDTIIERFAKTGGQPPQGVKMLGRWHNVANGSGVSVSEAEDLSAIARWALDWNDVMDMEIYPALTDDQLGAVLAGLQSK